MKLTGLTSTWERPIAAGPITPPKRNTRPRKKYVMKVPRARKIPREVRAQIYQLELTRIECEHEIRRLMTEHGVKSKASMWVQMTRIMKDRG